MSLYDQIVDAVVSELQAINNIGNVYNRRRYLQNEIDVENAFLATIDGSDIIRGWEVSRRRAPLSGGSFAEHVERVDVLEITGWNALDDSASSERAFQQLIDEVLGNLSSVNWDANPLSVASVYGADPPDLTIFDEMVFAGILCHRAVIEFRLYVDWDVSGY